MLFEPSERVSLDGVATTRNHLLIHHPGQRPRPPLPPAPGDDGVEKEEIELPGLGSAGIGSTSDYDDHFFFTYTDFLTPSSLYLVAERRAGRGQVARPRSSTPTG